MQIYQGQFRGRKLKFGTSKELRPTKSRVREALFNVIGHDLSNKTFLDLFAGTGAMGVEAISAGASVTFVDTDCTLVRHNLSLIKSTAEVAETDYSYWLKQCKTQFDFIYLDPPWRSEEMYLDSLNAVCEFDILAAHGIIICEHNRRLKIPELPNKKIIFNRKYGETVITLLQ